MTCFVNKSIYFSGNTHTKCFVTKNDCNIYDTNFQNIILNDHKISGQITSTKIAMFNPFLYHFTTHNLLAFLTLKNRISHRARK